MTDDAFACHLPHQASLLYLPSVICSLRLSFASLLIALSLFGQGSQRDQREIFQDAAAALASGDYAAAERGFQQILQASPNHVGALGNLGVLYARTNRYAKAVDAYSHAIRLSPNDKGLLLNLGLAYVKQQRYAQALPYFQRVANLDPSLAQARELLATCLLHAGKVDSAVKLLESLPSADPHNSGVLFLLGIAYLKRQEREKSAQ